MTASLADRLAALSFLDRTADEVTGLLVESVTAWAREQGWRVYPGARSVLPLPPPYEHRFSTLDVACARPAGAPIVIEVDATDRQRTVDKLRAEAAAGRIAIWVRWGTGTVVPPPLPVRLVTCAVTSRKGVGGRGRLYFRLPASDRPAPPHTATGTAVEQRPGLFTD